MSLYNIEFFKPNFAYRSSVQVQDISYEFDYLSLSKNKLKVTGNVNTDRGDYIRISKGNREIVGIVTGVSESDTITIEYMNFLSIFDVNVYADVLSVINEAASPLEHWIANTIQSLFVKNADPLQNISGLELGVSSYTVGKKNLGYDSNIFNLYELITKVLTQHDIVVDVSVDMQNKVIKMSVGKRKTDEKHIEADLPNVLDKEFSIEKGNEAVNKVIVVNEDNQSEQISYFLLSDGTVTNEADNMGRITPVVFESTFITVDDEEIFAEKAYDEALSILMPDEYDNYISITVSNDDSLVKSDEWIIGQKAVIFHKGYEYHTILTGMEINKNRTKLMFGAVRKELTKKLKRRK